jgi:hypothetical protein
VVEGVRGVTGACGGSDDLFSDVFNFPVGKESSSETLLEPINEDLMDSRPVLISEGLFPSPVENGRDVWPIPGRGDASSVAFETILDLTPLFLPGEPPFSCGNPALLVNPGREPSGFREPVLSRLFQDDTSDPLDGSEL